MTKSDLLAEIKKRMESNKALPLRDGATQIVFGEGNSDAQVYFLGEAPGYYEDKEGRPFVGRAGVLLTKLIEDIGMKRGDVYISNVLRYRPPNNRDPEQEEIDAFAPYVDKEIEVINPKVIVTLGRFSMAKFFPDFRISGVHGTQHKINWKGKARIVVPMYHPAAALRNGDMMEAIRVDFQTIKKAMDANMEDLVQESKIEEDNDNESQLNLFAP